MKTGIKIVILFLIVIGLYIFSSYFFYAKYVDNIVDAREQRYSACVAAGELFNESHIRETSFKEVIILDIKACLSRGGCYTSCGSSCGDEQIKSFKEYILDDNQLDGILCSAVCVPTCLEPI